MDKFTEKLMDKIDCSKIKPKSKLLCKIKSISKYLILSGIILLDSFLFSIIFFFIEQSDFDLNMALNHSVLFLVPYFWVALFLAIIVISYFYVFYKFKGYRLSPIISMFIVAFVTISLGLCLHSVNELNESADDVMAINIPFYYDIINGDDLWDDRESGYLLGRIKSIEIDKERNIIKLLDCKNKDLFTLYYEGDIKDVYRCNFILNDRYKIIATKDIYGNYKIKEIRPWHKGDCPMKR